MAASPTRGATASPPANPPAEVLIYDGDCRFCVRRARWFQRKSHPETHALPFQQLDLAQQTLTRQTLSRQAVWIDAAGKQHLGHRAVAKSLIHIGGWWGICGRIMLVPPISWLARGIYRLVARQRHRLA